MGHKTSATTETEVPETKTGWLPIHETMKGRYGNLLTDAEIQTLYQDARTKKLAMRIQCRECGTEHVRFTSDIKQTQGICPTCRDKNRVNRKAKKHGIPVV